MDRPIIEAWSQLEEQDPVREALDVSLQLCAEAFHSITKQRRTNILKVTDPSFTNLLQDPTAFSIRESGRIFGPKFISWMVQEAREDRDLGSLGTSSSSRGSTSVVRSATKFSNGFNTRAQFQRDIFQSSAGSSSRSSQRLLIIWIILHIVIKLGLDYYILVRIGWN